MPPLNLSLTNKTTTSAERKEAEIDIYRYAISPFAEYVAPEPLMTFDKSPVITRDNFSTVTGPAKSRKTFFISLIIGRYLAQDPKARVCWIDTEQSEYHCNKVAKRVCKIAGWSNEADSNGRFLFLATRPTARDIRKQILEVAANSQKFDIIVLDGSRDVLKSFNDEGEVGDLMDLLLKLTAENHLHIINVIHTNPNPDGSGGKKARGHQGTELYNKSESVILLEKDGELTKITWQYTREKEPRTMWMGIDANGLPYFTNKDPLQSRAISLEDSLEGEGPFKKSTIVYKIKKLFECKDTSAYNTFKKLQDAGYIFEQSNDEYTINSGRTDRAQQSESVLGSDSPTEAGEESLF